MELNRTTYGAGMKHPTHGEVSINRYGEWKHKGKTGDSSNQFSSLDKHLSSLNEATPPKNTDVADKSYLKDMGKKPTVKSDIKNFGRFLAGKKETNEGKQPESDTVPFVTNADQPPFDGPYTKTPSNVKDKSGAVHTPMSRAKDLAKAAMKRVKTEMLGKAPGNNG